jgi:hypothetical protein
MIRARARGIGIVEGEREKLSIATETIRLSAAARLLRRLVVAR